MGIEEKLPSGIPADHGREGRRLHAQGLAVAGDLRPGLLRHRDDDHRRPALRPRPLRHGGLPRLAAPGRPDDRRRPGEPEDGPGAAPDLRPDGRAEVGARDGRLRVSSGGMFNNYAIVQGVDHVVPVDIYLPGCPPRPEMLIDAILKLHDADPGHAARRRTATRRSGRPRRPRWPPRRPRDEGPAAVTGDRAATSDRRDDVRQPDDGTAEPPRSSSRRAAGMFGVNGTGDTSGYGGLVRAGRAARRSRRARTAASSTRSPTRSTAASASGARSTAAIEQVVVDRGELTFHVAPRAPASPSPRRCATTPTLRFELCLGVSAACTTPQRDRPRAARRLPPAVDHPQPADPARGDLPRTPTRTSRRWSRSTRPPTGTSARPATSSGSSSTATRR